jgi:hypothetical protein
MTKPTQTKEPPLLEVWTIRRELGDTLAARFTRPIEACDREIEKAEKELAEKMRTRRFLDRKARAAVEQMETLKLAGVDEIQIYDEDLRIAMAGAKVETTKYQYNSRSNKHEKRPTGATSWAELVKRGATDTQIRTNLLHTQPAYRNDGPKLKTGSDPGLHVIDRGYGSKADVRGAELVIAVRRVLGIPFPGSVKLADAPAKKKKAPAKAPPKKPAVKKPPAAKTKAQKKTEEVEALANKAIGAGATPPAGPKPAVKPFPEWARAARKALVRKSIDPAVVKEEEPWTEWHKQSLAPAAAVAEWVRRQNAGGAEAAGKPVLPPARVIEISPSVPIDGNVSYDAIELGVSDGDIAAATDGHDFSRPSGAVPVLSAVVRYDGDLYIVRTHRHIGGESLLLRPLLRKAGGLRPTKGDELLGRAVIVNNETRYIGPEDDGIRVDDKAPGAAPRAPITGGKAKVADLVRPGMFVKTSYGSGPFKVVELQSHADGETLVVVDPETKPSKKGTYREDDKRWINDLRVEDGRIFSKVREHGAAQDDEVLIVPLVDVIDTIPDEEVEGELSDDDREPAKTNPDADTEVTKPGEVYELTDLSLTADRVSASFAGVVIARGDPARVPAPLTVDGYPYLYMGMVSGLRDNVARLVRLLPETDSNVDELKKLRAEPKGAYCGRRVQDPSGDTYVVGPEDYNLLVKMPSTEKPAAKKRAVV